MQHNFVFQLTFYPFHDNINSYRLTKCNHDTVQIHSRHEGHSATHSDFKFRYARDTDAILALIQIRIQIQYIYASDTEAILLLIQIQLSYTIQIHSRHKIHSITHSDSDLRYNLDTLQTQMLFYYSFRPQHSDIVRIHSRYGCHSVTYYDSP